MKNKFPSRASSLFLMELIIAILFFCLTATACVQLFFKSHQLSEEAQILNDAVNICTNAAEVIAVSDDIGASVIKKYYDENMAESTEKECSYVMTVRTTVRTGESNNMINAAISMKNIENNEVIYSLDVCHNIKNNIRREGN